jgi:hypothetical protein
MTTTTNRKKYTLLLIIALLLALPTSAQDATPDPLADAPLRIAWEHERYYAPPNAPLNLTAQLTNALPASVRNTVQNIFVEVSLPQGVDLAYPQPFTERVLIDALPAGESLPLSWPLMIGPDVADELELTIDIEAGELFASSSTVLISRPRSPSLGYYLDGSFTFVDGLGNGQIIGSVRTGFTAGQPIVGDWNGDGYDGFGLYLDGMFYLYNAVPALDISDASPDLVFPVYDAPPDGLPLAGDWDGDGIDSVMVYEAGTFYLRNFPTAGNADRRFSYGDLAQTIEPLVGDWNGDGIDSVGVYVNGVFLLRNRNDDGGADVAFQYGEVSDALPLVGDWNGDRVDGVGLLRDGNLLLRDAPSAGNADIDFALPQRYRLAQPLVGYWAGTSDS